MQIDEFLERAFVDEDWLESIISYYLNQNEPMVKEYIKEQWTAGENEDKEAVGYYKKITEDYYAKINPPFSGLPKIAGKPYNLMWSTELFSRTFLEHKLELPAYVILVDSESSTRDPLFAQIKREGLVDDPFTIFGLNEENYEKLIVSVNQEIINKFIENHV